LPGSTQGGGAERALRPDPRGFDDPQRLGEGGFDAEMGCVE
jgi:hypothetical protein